MGRKFKVKNRKLEFQPHSFCHKKRTAKTKAATMRKKGYYARIVLRPDWKGRKFYEVYVRKRGTK